MIVVMQMNIEVGMIILDVVSALIIVDGLDIVEVVETHQCKQKYHALKMVKRNIVGGCAGRLAPMIDIVIHGGIHLVGHSDI